MNLTKAPAGAIWDIVLPARGTDRTGHFEVAAPPDRWRGFDKLFVQKQALRRKLDNNPSSESKRS